jgi:subtilase family serine protease
VGALSFRRRLLCAALGAASLCLSAATLAPGAEARSTPVAANAARVGNAAPTQQIELTLPLVARDAGLPALAQAVSTPGSSRYAHYRPIDQLARQFGASAATQHRVVRYLRAAGATDVKVDATGLFAYATVTARLARRLFGTPLARYRAARQAEFVAPTSAARVPPALRGLIGGVVGLDTRPLGGTPVHAPRHGRFRAHAAQPSSAMPRTGSPAGCLQGVSAGAEGGAPPGFTPNQYLTAYGLTQLHAAGFSGQGVRVALIEIDGFNFSDLQAFGACFGLGTPPVQAFGVGVHHPLAPGGESTLDLEALDAAAPALAGIDVYETSANAANTLRALTAPLQNRHRRPQVISASLGLCEPAVAGAVGSRGIRATESALEMAAISGITILASSGDQGSADCTGSDGLPIPRLSINYPASSWWVTGVGGTNLSLGPANQIFGQVVWNDAGVQPGAAAGGGSSVLFRRPSYQTGVVSANRRAEPDVSMLADVIPGYAVFCSAPHDCVNSSHPNPWQSVGGTSAGTPLLAGGFAVIDQELELHQRLDLGFVNPLLYELGRSPAARPQAFDDVVTGGNDIGSFIPNAEHPLGCCQAGPGFDLASGWGSVNLAQFSAQALFLQPPQIHLSVPGKQDPLKSHKLRATVTCAGACRVAAYALVKVGRSRPFEADSPIRDLPAAGAKAFTIRLSSRRMRTIRAGLRRHRKVVATLHAVVITGQRTVQFRSDGIRVRIR